SQHDGQVFFAYSLLITTGIVTVVWIVTTFLTKPTDESTLIAFYRRTRPSLAGWEPIAKLAPEVRPSGGAGVRLVEWILGCALIYFSLFGVGAVIFGNYTRGIIFIAIA